MDKGCKKGNGNSMYNIFWGICLSWLRVIQSRSCDEDSIETSDISLYKHCFSRLVGCTEPGMSVVPRSFTPDGYSGWIHLTDSSYWAVGGLPRH
jgi:hypothetical protein